MNDPHEFLSRLPLARPSGAFERRMDQLFEEASAAARRRTPRPVLALVYSLVGALAAGVTLALVRSDPGEAPRTYAIAATPGIQSMLLNTPPNEAAPASFRITVSTSTPSP
jgi:hypothetical protein